MTNTTRTTALTLSLLIVAGPAVAEEADDWSGGFDEPVDAEAITKQGAAWALSPEGSLRIEGFTYMERTPDSGSMSAARYAVDARLQLEAKSATTTARASLLFRRDFADPARDRTDAEEAYLDFGRGTTRIRAGRSLHRWGVSNIYKPSDILNPTDYTDFLEYEKRGSFSLWARRSLGPVFVELFYLPLPEPDIIPLPSGVAADGTLVASSRWVRGSLPIEQGGVPVAYRFGEPATRPPSARNTQGALRLSGQLARFELSAGYAYLFDHVPLLVPYATPMSDHIEVELRPEYRRRHFAMVGIARSFGKSRLALDASISIPRDLPDNRPAVESDDGFATVVFSFDHVTRELAPNHTLQVAVDLTTTQPLEGELPLDDVSRLRYPFVLAAMGRVSYHAGNDKHFHLEVIESFEGFGLGRLEGSGGKSAFILQPKVELTFSSYVQMEIGATLLVGNDNTLFGRYRDNSRFFWSAKTDF
jgi:hypothetical protein